MDLRETLDHRARMANQAIKDLADHPDHQETLDSQETQDQTANQVFFDPERLLPADQASPADPAPPDSQDAQEKVAKMETMDPQANQALPADPAVQETTAVQARPENQENLVPLAAATTALLLVWPPAIRKCRRTCTDTTPVVLLLSTFVLVTAQCLSRLPKGGMHQIYLQ